MFPHSPLLHAKLPCVFGYAFSAPNIQFYSIYPKNNQSNLWLPPCSISPMFNITIPSHRIEILCLSLKIACLYKYLHNQGVTPSSNGMISYGSLSSFPHIYVARDHVIKVCDSYPSDIYDLLAKHLHPNIVQVTPITKKSQSVPPRKKSLQVKPLCACDASSYVNDITKLRCLAEQISSALAHIHMLKICHCDVRPSNIFVSLNGNLFYFIISYLSYAIDLL